MELAKLIYTSDNATLRNDDSGTISVVMPGSVVVAGSSTYTVFQDIVIGSNLGETRVRISSSKLGAGRFFAGFLGVNRTGTPSPYILYALATRISPTTLRCFVIAGNPTGSPLTTAAGAETFLFKINTFVAPAT